MKDGIYLSEYGSRVLLYGVPKKPEQWYVDQCRENLVLLNVNSTNTETLNLSRAVNLRYLRIDCSGYTPTYRLVQSVESLTKLEELSLNNISLSDDLDLEQMTLLQHIDIRPARNNHSISVRGIHRQKALKSLRLWFALYPDRLDVSWFPGLEELALHFLEGSTRVCGVSSLKHLKELNLGGSSSRDIPDLSALPHLISLVLQHFPDCTTLPGIGSQKDLDYLCINNLGIRQIPDGIRNLKNLKNLKLYELELDELPHWLPELNLPFQQKWGDCIKFNETTIQGVDMTIFDQPQDVILKWFESLKQDDTVPLQEVKVVFLGDGEAGKTHTIARLLNDGNAPRPDDFDDKATPGIVIKDKPYILDGREVNVHYWDFGGQEILHSMHRMFLTERTLYVVLINARDDTQDDRARYWLHNLKSFANDSPVLLVLNKIDQNPNASINETELRELYSGLRRVVKLSARDYSPEQFNAALTDALMEEIRGLGTIGTLWPTSWARLKDGLRNMSGNFIMGAEYRNMCRNCGVDKNQKELLHWFNDLGISFCYQGSRRLENYVILRPDWITNGIYTLLFNKSEETVNGVIPKQIIYDMLDPLEGSTYRRVKNTAYNMDETEYVLEVMRKFRLSYPVSAQAEFIPALCQRDSMPIAKTYAADKTTLEFRMTYGYLPDNVIHRLMVEMRQDLQLTDVWRTGALFRQPGTGLSAVVKSEGDVLRIFVRSENAMHNPNTYLCILKENIDRINRDMRLAEPYAEVVYKYDSGSECFDYEDLLAALHDGDETYRSKKLRRRIPILDILNQTGFKEEQKLKMLQENILTACMQLQCNPTYQGAKEDVCNTYLRDSLRNMGHLVNDQTFQGTGSGGKSFGELDLEIRQEPNIPWTILEALRITDGYKTTEWNRHLKKLLDNYNPSGLNHLFLLTYLHCETDDFGALMDKYSEHVKWYDPDDYQRLPSTFAHLPLRRHGDPAGLRVMRCTYDRSGSPTTVTHIFVRIAP
ncbi:MAG: hypothetical protein IJO05_09215 [Oscillospiraceae bacterium]|nr:hypothetical protein [Oscillospiraceae bacterium]